jgi:hypothetical protein
VQKVCSSVTTSQQHNNFLFLAADAAVWNVQAVANTSTTIGYLSTVDPSDPMNTSNRAGGLKLPFSYFINSLVHISGVCVQFELVESGTGSTGEGHSSSLLVCSHNEGLNRSEAALVAFGRDGQTVIVDGEGECSECLWTHDFAMSSQHWCLLTYVYVITYCLHKQFIYNVR